MVRQSQRAGGAGGSGRRAIARRKPHGLRRRVFSSALHELCKRRVRQARSAVGNGLRARVEKGRGAADHLPRRPGRNGSGAQRAFDSRRQVEKALASAGVPVTVLRAAMIIGSGSASFEILRYLVERLPVMVTPKWVRTPCQPIAVRNVIGYLVGVLSSPETSRAHIRHRRPGGSELPANHAHHGGRTRPAEAPGDSGAGADAAAQSYWIHLVTPLGHSIAKPLAEGLRNPVVCREDHITHIIPQKCSPCAKPSRRRAAKLPKTR